MCLTSSVYGLDHSSTVSSRRSFFSAFFNAFSVQTTGSPAGGGIILEGPKYVEYFNFAVIFFNIFCAFELSKVTYII